jgi:hypothetical protein
MFGGQRDHPTLIPFFRTVKTALIVDYILNRQPQ